MNSRFFVNNLNILSCIKYVSTGIVFCFGIMTILGSASQPIPTDRTSAQPTAKPETKKFTPTKQMETDCFNVARRSIAWKDRESIRFEGSTGVGVEELTGEKKRFFGILVNAKNSWGAYGGADMVICYLEGKKVVKALAG